MAKNSTQAMEAQRPQQRSIRRQASQSAAQALFMLPTG
jgi:hypothetical protein